MIIILIYILSYNKNFIFNLILINLIEKMVKNINKNNIDIESNSSMVGFEPTTFRLTVECSAD